MRNDTINTNQFHNLRVYLHLLDVDHLEAQLKVVGLTPPLNSRNPVGSRVRGRKECPTWEQCLLVLLGLYPVAVDPCRVALCPLLCPDRVLHRVLGLVPGPCLVLAIHRRGLMKAAALLAAAVALLSEALVVLAKP
jgi:hypothetical protein